MARTIVVCGHGPGISDAVARRFGKEGFSVAIVARNGERLAAAAAALGQAGIPARAFQCDLGNPDAVRAMIREVHAALGPISALHWNAVVFGAGDSTTCTTEELHGVFDAAVHGMVAAVQEALPDLRSEKGAVLVTGAGFAFYDPELDGIAAAVGAMGLALAKAAQHKVAGLLHQKLAPEGVYVGEVVVLDTVKGTPFDRGSATLEPSTIADKLWELHQGRTQASVTVP